MARMASYLVVEYRDTERRHRHPTTHHETEYLQARGAERDPDAELPPACRDRVGHDPVDAEHREYEREHRERRRDIGGQPLGGQHVIEDLLERAWQYDRKLGVYSVQLT